MKTQILAIDCEERGSFWLNINSGYKILFSTTAEEGMEMLSQNISLVFLSLALRDTDSLEMIGLIRKKYPSLPVIVTAPCGPEEPCMCMEAFKRGAWDYIMKPLDAEVVLQKIEMLLTEKVGKPVPAGAASPVKTFGHEQYPGIPSHFVSGVLRVKDFVAQNYSDSLSLSAACKMAAISKTYFCRFFKCITGHSLRSYQHAVKIRMAEQLLKDRKLSVTEVAIMLGYNDSNYFSTIYKKFTGFSPRHRRASDRDSERSEEGLNRC
ncbi:MAG TPA: DNA-binding response regulator [Thermodesulfovibrionales bacterium]|nr:DNA-binding response regulator [Thermodesulfovibrionales bacterium]